MLLNPNFRDILCIFAGQKVREVTDISSSGRDENYIAGFPVLVLVAGRNRDKSIGN
jgi:hypothetical protein